MLQILDLFSGLGGFSLAAEMVGGFETVAFCEKNPFCRKILKKHWPNVPIIEDISDVTVESLQRIGVTKIDVVCGGPPCQPFSAAGKRKGKTDKRNMFPEFLRVVGDVRPQWAIIENVKQLLTTDSGGLFREILWEFSKIGMSTEWDCISAAEVGAVHKRERIWIIAYSSNPNSPRAEVEEFRASGQERQYTGTSESAMVRQGNREVTTEGASSSSSLSTNSNSVGCNNGVDTQQEYKDLLHGQWDSEKNQQPRGEWFSGAESLRPTTADPESSGRATSGGAIAQTGANATPVSSGTESVGVKSSDLETKTFSRFRRSHARFPPRMDRSGGEDYLMRHADLPHWLTLATDSENIPYRKERLEALGNSICINTAVVAWQRVLQVAEQQRTIAQ